MMIKQTKLKGAKMNTEQCPKQCWCRKESKPHYTTQKERDEYKQKMDNMSPKERLIYDKNIKDMSDHILRRLRRIDLGLESV